MSNMVFNHHIAGDGERSVHVYFMDSQGRHETNGERAFRHYGQPFAQCTATAESTGCQCRHVDQSNPLKWSLVQTPVMVREGGTWREIPKDTWCLTLAMSELDRTTSFRCGLHR